jgi:toxin-antitoxin system PIN domain toxin
VIALDTNLLVYAHRPDSPWHGRSRQLVTELAEAPAPWVIPWPCLHEFIAVVTHPRVFKPATPLETAIDQIEAWMESPSLVFISESSIYWETLRETLNTGRVTGPRVHDARIAALCQIHGISELWSADRDFNRFPGIRVRNPLVG